ncbi:hypothetical protein ACEXQD_07190 [Herbiconiux sp. P15]|uniref:hypothetical protein n=1 Tax=Herbiconiux liukaitaii TaxID=3342799 RepID=UPI0035B8A9E3
MRPPVIVRITEVEGTTVTVPLGTLLVLATADDASVTAWSVEIADASVAEFVAGRDDGSARFNPGLAPRAEGVTEVTLRDGRTNGTVAFTLSVTPRPA